MHKLTNSIKGNRNIDIAIPNGGMHVGELIGYRMWKAKRLLDGSLLLYSYVLDFCVWQPGQTMVCDVLTNNRTVHGFYAWKRKQDALKYVKNRHDAEREVYQHNVRTKTVVGTIQMWGEVVEHALGFRSEYASIHSIDQIINGSVHELRSLREKYGV